MRLNEIEYNDARPIDGYGPGFFRVAGKVLEGPVLVSAQGAVTWGGLEDTAPLLALKEKIDVLFIGTGAEVAFLPRAFANSWKRQVSRRRPWRHPPLHGPTMFSFPKDGGWRWRFSP